AYASESDTTPPADQFSIFNIQFPDKTGSPLRADRLARVRIVPELPAVPLLCPWLIFIPTPLCPGGVDVLP
ncbi:MAG: hypothetical protein WCB15_09885, partial [Desulfobacterales bacterium]